MLLDERQLISATELNRNPSRFVALASKGRRQVILQNNVPVAALISMEDLRRLDALDRATDTPSLVQALTAQGPAETTSGGGGQWEQPAGTTLLGRGKSGPPVTVALRENHFYIGAATTELELVRSAAITGALPARPLQFWVMTGARVVRLVHAQPESLTVTRHPMAGRKAGPIFDELDAEIERRNQLLDRYDVNTLDEARAAMAATGDQTVVPDLIIVGEDLDEHWPRFSHYVPTANKLGVYAWAFVGEEDQAAALESRLQHFRIRVATHTSREASSRAAVGTEGALLLEPGAAMLVDNTLSVHAPPMHFQITAATNDGVILPKADTAQRLSTSTG